MSVHAAYPREQEERGTVDIQRIRTYQQADMSSTVSKFNGNTSKTMNIWMIYQCKHMYSYTLNKNRSDNFHNWEESYLDTHQKLYRHCYPILAACEGKGSNRFRQAEKIARRSETRTRPPSRNLYIPTPLDESSPNILQILAEHLPF